MPHKNTLLTKILLLFVLILLPLILMSAILLKKSNYDLKTQLFHSIQANNNTYLSQLDHTLEQIYFTNIPFVDQSNIRKIANPNYGLTVYDKSFRIHLLMEQLSNICSTNSFLSSAHIYFKDIQNVYNSSQYTKGSFQVFSEEQYNFLAAFAAKSGTLHYFKDPIEEKNTLSILIASKETPPNRILKLTLSEKKIKSYLESNQAYQEDYYLFQTKGDWIVSNMNPAMKKVVLESFDADLEQPNDFYTNLKLGNQSYYAFYSSLPYMDGNYVRLIPSHLLLSSIQLHSFLLITFLIFVFFACLIFFIGIYRLIHRPLVKLTNGFTQVETGNFDIRITEIRPSDFSYLYHAFNNMTARLAQLIEKDYNQKMLLQKAELKQLQAQINPHFLYNSFFMLQRMIKTDPTDGALKMADSLALYFRYITKNSMDTVPLLEEYKHAKTYSYIQGLRFEGRIQIHFEELPTLYQQLLIPKLTLQPILENAFQYGLNNKLKDGQIHIHFEVNTNSLYIYIEDNGEELTDETLLLLQNRLSETKADSNTYEMSGILNINRRLAVYFQDKANMDVLRSPMGGLCVTLQLPNHITRKENNDDSNHDCR